MTASLDGFTLGRTLGSGFSAKVKHGTSADGSEYALKIFRLDNPQFNDKAFKLLKEEVEATTQLDHRHVVKYFEFKERANMIKKNGTAVEVAYIAQEMIAGGELFDYVANSGPFSEDICKYFFKQMLQGVHYIHSKGFSHRDLKPENILLDKMYDVKIVDFGFACPLEGRDGSGTNRSVIGTPGYMAPEILAKQPYQGQVVDLFALGVILFILYSGHPPFQMANEEDNYYKLLATNRSDLFWKAHSNPQRKAADFYSEEFKDLITCMLQFHPHQRLCIADIIGHPWLANGGVASAEEVRANFADRHAIHKQRAHAEAEQKAARRNQVNNGARRDFQFGGKVYLSHED
jgi:serine/threonine protein kinase